MNPLELTVNQLKRAATIKEQIDVLNRELRGILGGEANTGARRQGRRTMSAAAKRKIAAAQRARWARVRGTKPASPSAKPAAKAKKKSMSPAARAKVAAKMRAYWAAKKAGKK
ncbi:MAG TPA: hypothetical protein VIB79_29865 [Candidatus Binatia bacterium]